MKETKPFVFIANKGFARGENDRGGIQFLLRAYAEEFTKDEPVLLKIKINTVYNPPNWNLDNEIKKLNLNPTNHPKCEIMLEHLDTEQLRKFYCSGDVFVSTPMAEGFGLPGLEAMACGLPNIQTNFGGQMEYLNEKNSWLIDEGAMVDVPDDIQYEEVKWFKPSISAIRKTLRDVYEKFKLDDNNQIDTELYDVKQSMKKEALKTAKKFTWTNTGKIATKCLKELE